MFNKRAVAVMIKEYKQMEDMDVLISVSPDSFMAGKNEMHSGQTTL